MKRYLFSISLVLTGLVYSVANASAQDAPRPNVVIIYADDMGWGDVGCHGVEDVLTPNIDRLAAQGVLFSQGYVSASVCGPSRCGLMTGVYQQRLACGENPNTIGFPDASEYPYAGLPTRQPILPEMLQPLGYHCGMMGKWHLGLHETMRPNARGFDEYYGFLNGAHDYELAFPDFARQKALWPLFRNNEMQPEYEGYLTDTFSDKAVDFIERTDDEPFFLYVAYNAVHHPWQVPEKYLERTRDLSEVEDRRFFAAMVLAMDDGIGRIMDAIDMKGVTDDTILFFISDNGSPRGQGLDHPVKDNRKERGDCTMSSPGPFRGFKGDTFEGGIRIPFIMRWPGRIEAGSRYDQPVVNLDVMPTVLAELGIEQPSRGLPFDGVDLMPYLEGERGDARPHDVLYWRRDEDYALRRGDWKLACNDASCPQNADVMLFDLASDPGEYNDLSEERPELTQELQALFDAWDSPLPPSHCWGSPSNRKPTEDGVVVRPPNGPSPATSNKGGVLELMPLSATLHGQAIQRRDVAISHWREPNEWVEWTLLPKDSGRYEVVLEYAAPHASSIRVQCEGELLKADLPPRRDWGDSAQRRLGVINLQGGRESVLALKSGDSWRPVNVRRVLLKPVDEIENDDRPNIVLIMADDLGAECIGAYGCLDYKTPVLDRLAREGVKFENCHAQPLCTPSRVQIMTGRYNHRNYIGFGNFDTEEITFGHILQEAGYDTCMAGKWQLGGDYATPIDLGFEHYCLQNAIDPVEYYERSTRGRERYWGYPPITADGRLYESDEQYGPDMISEFASDFICEQRDRPFFLYYPMILPHSPYAPSPLSEDGDKGGGKVCELKYFKDMIEYVDVLVGRIIESLEASGQRENTILLFTGDNGTTYPVQVTATAPEGYARVLGINRVRHASQLPEGQTPTLRDGLWEGPLTATTEGDIPGGKDLMNYRGTHVPLIVDWPRYRSAHAEFGHSCEDLVDFTDMLVTFAELADADLPQDRTIDGRSFAPRLTGEGESPREWIFCHYWGFGRKQDEARTSVHDARWKLYDDGSFFDLDVDPEETTPLTVLSEEALATKRRFEKAMIETLAE